MTLPYQHSPHVAVSCRVLYKMPIPTNLCVAFLLRIHAVPVHNDCPRWFKRATPKIIQNIVTNLLVLTPETVSCLHILMPGTEVLKTIFIFIAERKHTSFFFYSFGVGRRFQESCIERHMNKVLLTWPK